MGPSLGPSNAGSLSAGTFGSKQTATGSFEANSLNLKANAALTISSANGSTAPPQDLPGYTAVNQGNGSAAAGHWIMSQFKVGQTSPDLCQLRLWKHS